MRLFKKKTKLELYTEKEEAIVEAHITKYFGKYDMVYHELALPDIRCDVAQIPPSPGRDFVTLVTMGAGAHKMSIPKRLREDVFCRAEYIITLPPNRTKEKHAVIANYWPLDLLRNVARLPIRYNTFVHYMHTLSNDAKNSPYSDDTKLCSAVVNFPVQFGDDSSSLATILPNGEAVAFWQLIPIYESELALAQTEGSDALIDLLGDIVMRPVDINRPAVV